ncbi:membrane-associated protein, putative [Bodo saltans]|uniref:Membrane-associated protein, putative n=1 Tax=Bodo saltans TaxID=75058 RepID=A0A0S4KHY6_BODSA|nr:membrane-associated protein, putative [Bodo saltans]|eukprot:CUI15294.1 membrane-associated protein, putative [Bodo saltans]
MNMTSVLLCSVIVALWVQKSCDAALIASSQLQLCTNSGADSGLDCAEKFVMSITVDGGSGGGESVQYQWTSATDASTSDSVTITDPVTIVVTKSIPVMRYPVYYVRNFNADAYETVVYTGLFGCAADSSSSSPTCGRAYSTTTGAAIPYSEGYCCSCSFCDLISLCDSDSRANTDCSLFGDAQSASCLRFDDQWYGGYTIGPGQRDYIITVNVSSSSQGTVLLTLGPDALGAADTTHGVAARLVGDFSSFVEPWDLTTRMLLVPTGSPTNARVAAGQAEWLIVPLTAVTVDGTECNKIGVSYAGFNGQGNRCVMQAGSCTANQIDDLRAADVAALAAGKAATYFLSAYGTFQYASTTTVNNISNVSTTTPYIAYQMPSVSASLITLTFAADRVRYVVNVANGTIVAAYLTSAVISSSSRDGVLVVKVRNVGTVTAEFSLSVSNCSDGVFPVTAQVTAIAPGANFSTTFQVHVTVASTVVSQCQVSLLNSLQVVLDKVPVSWTTASINETDGAQGGSAPTGGGTTIISSAWDSVTCPECAWYSPLCFLTQECFWGFVIQVAVVLVVLTGLLLLLKCQGVFTRSLLSSSQEDQGHSSGKARIDFKEIIRARQIEQLERYTPPSYKHAPTSRRQQRRREPMYEDTTTTSDDQSSSGSGDDTACDPYRISVGSG